MGNVEPVSKKFKNFSFFRRELAGKKTAKTITAASRMKAVPSISLKILAFPSSLFRQGSKYILLSKKSGNWNFYPPQLDEEKFGCRKFGIWWFMDLIVVCKQKSDE